MQYAADKFGINHRTLNTAKNIIENYSKDGFDPDAWQTPSFRAGKDRARSQRLRFPNDIGDTVLQGGEDVHKTAEKWTEKAKEAIANEAERYEKEIGL
jgi:hypothetical protein